MTAAKDGTVQLEEKTWDLVNDARPLLPKAAFFLGDLRDGLPMLNMQAAYLISTKNFTEKQVGLLFLIFGMSQFVFMTPAGYFLDYSNRKIVWVIFGSLATSMLTIVSVVTASDGGENMPWLLCCLGLQGAITAILPPGFAGITLGIVGSSGFTYQVSRNRMMNHIGTALTIATGSLVAYFLYPNIGALFTVSPLAALGVWYYLHLIVPTHVNKDAARSLILESPTMAEYEHVDEVATVKQQAAVTPLPWANSVQPIDCCGGIISPVYDYASNSSAEAVQHQPPAQANVPRSHRVDAPIFTPSLTERANTPSYQPPSDIAPRLPSTIDDDDAAAAEVAVSVLTADPITMTPIEQQQQQQQKHANEEVKRRASSSSMPSFRLGYKSHSNKQVAVGNVDTNMNAAQESDAHLDKDGVKARSPLAVLRDPILAIFVIIVFFFHMANSSVLPLVMQSLALQDAQIGILLSGLCIFIAQGCMTFFAKICGDYSPFWGRKSLTLVGLASLPLRCFLLTLFISAEENVETVRGAHITKALILSTQFLDSVGAGVIGTMQVLITSDISKGTGRFSLIMGVTTAAGCIGATVSGYLGQALAQDYGYSFAFTALGLMSVIPLTMYTVCMPETLPDEARPNAGRRRRRLKEFMQNINKSFSQLGKKQPKIDLTAEPQLFTSGKVELV